MVVRAAKLDDLVMYSRHTAGRSDVGRGRVVG